MSHVIDFGKGFPYRLILLFHLSHLLIYAQNANSNIYILVTCQLEPLSVSILTGWKFRKNLLINGTILLHTFFIILRGYSVG
jgi:hypothetical protein